jgi:hypothetical protein
MNSSFTLGNAVATQAAGLTEAASEAVPALVLLAVLGGVHPPSTTMLLFHFAALFPFVACLASVTLAVV